MCLPGGPTTISLLLASLSKRLSARWRSPVQRMNHQGRFFSLRRCSSEALCTPKGASLSCIWERCSVCLQSDSSLSGFLSQLNTQKAVGVEVGFICSKHTPGSVCTDLLNWNHWRVGRFDYFIPPSANTGTSSSFLLAMTAVSSEVHITTDNKRERHSASWWYNYVLFIFWPDTIHISSESPLQLLYFRQTVSLHTNTAAYCWWNLSDFACGWLKRENGSVWSSASISASHIHLLGRGCGVRSEYPAQAATSRTGWEKYV